MNAVAGYPLFQALAEVADFRKPRGKRHLLAAFLALSCAAALCGASALTAISQWGRDHSNEMTLSRIINLCYRLRRSYVIIA